MFWIKYAVCDKVNRKNYYPRSKIMKKYTIVGSITSKGGVDEALANTMFDDIISVFGSHIEEQKDTFLQDGIVRFNNLHVNVDDENDTISNKLVQFVNTYIDAIGDLQFSAQGDAVSDIWYYKLYPDNSLMVSKATISFDNWRKIN